jgi:hypothetical protein
MYTQLWLENLKGRDHSEDIDIHRRITVDWIVKKQPGRV